MFIVHLFALCYYEYINNGGHGMENNFSLKIKELRESLKLTQSEFADNLGVTQAALSAYEKGTRNPTFETIMLVSKIFDVSIDWLCGLSNKKHIGYINYNDIFAELIKICSTMYAGDLLTKKNAYVLSPTIKDFDSVSFTATDSNFHDFFTAWSKMFINLKEKIIDDDLYNIWLERQLAKYDFSISGVPSCFSD